MLNYFYSYRIVKKQATYKIKIVPIYCCDAYNVISNHYNYYSYIEQKNWWNLIKDSLSAQSVSLRSGV